MSKAERTLDGARILLGAGDTEGACNRAYYAMFDAAHAALTGVGVEKADSEIRTHKGLLTVFNRTFRQHLGVDFAKTLNQVQQLRQLADYSAEPPEPDKAQWAVEQAEWFVSAIKQVLSKGSAFGPGTATGPP